MARNERSAGFILFRTSGNTSAAASPSIDFLLLDYGRHWEYPKGHVDKGESDLDAAIRELTEETGIADARVIPDFRHEMVYFFRDRKKTLVRKTVVFFLAETQTRNIVLSDEHVGFEFLSFERAMQRLTFPGAKQVLQSAHDFLANTQQ